MTPNGNSVEVALARCNSYEETEVSAALDAVLAPIGGLTWVQPGMRIAIKVNLVAPMKPDTAAAVHPAVVVSLVRKLADCGAQVTVGDSPGGIYNSAYVNRVYHITGMQVVEAAGGSLNQDFSESDKEVPQPLTARQIHYTAWLDQADAVIDLCKLKTHAMMGMTAAAKNMFGVIPGTYKPEYHCRYSDPMDFAKMLLDLDRSFPIRLCIADAVWGMEGNGPTAGKPRHIGCLAASTDPHKLDLVCAKLIGLTPRQVPTLAVAQQEHLIPETAEEIVTNTPIDDFCVPDFKTMLGAGEIPTRGAAALWGKAADRFLQLTMTPKPKVTPETCIGCGKCAEVCPAKAIQIENRLPHINRKVCIRCFCCQEFCPKGAMRLHRPPLARLAGKL